MADVDTTDIDKMLKDLPRIGDTLTSKSKEELGKRLVKSLPERVANEAKQRGLKNKNDTKPGQPDLTDESSWSILPDHANAPEDARFVLRTTAPHAAAHQVGTRAGPKYRIPKEGAGVSFIPEDGLSWYNNAPDTARTDDDGRVKLPYVKHPGVEDTDYISKPSRQTVSQAETDIFGVVQEVAYQYKFKQDI